MNTQEFWKIIDYSKLTSKGDKKLQERLIVKSLKDYSSEQITRFEIIFRQYLIESDDFKVLAVPKIVEGLVTDDTYLYFRCWLISEGEKTFRATLITADYLADKISRTTNIYFENLMSVATEAYILKVGKEDEDENFPARVAIKQGLNYNFPSSRTKGNNWHASQLPHLYPKLWAAFH